MAQKGAYTSFSPEDTQQLAAQLLTFWHPHKTTIVTLHGPLGAGKTTFAQGIARGLGITDNVRSPSYTLLQKHDMPTGSSWQGFYHGDAWRLAQNDDINLIGLDDALEPGNILALEWAENLPDFWDEFALVEHWRITFELLGETGRRIYWDQA